METHSDTSQHPQTLKMYFGSYGEFNQLNDTGLVKSNIDYYKLDEKKKQFTFFDKRDQLIRQYNYTISGDTILRLTSPSPAEKQAIEVFKKRIVRTGL